MRAIDYALAALAAICLLAWADAYREARELSRDRDELRSELAQARTERERYLVEAARYRELHHWLTCARGGCSESAATFAVGSK